MKDYINLKMAELGFLLGRGKVDAFESVFSTDRREKDFCDTCPCKQVNICNSCIDRREA